MNRAAACQRVYDALKGNRYCLAQLIQATGMHASTVSGRIKDLVDAGRVLNVGQKRKGKHMVNVYKVAE